VSEFLSQEEIDALLKGDDGVQEQEPELHLTDIERDALGEIGNIAMGSAATAMSQILNKRVSINYPPYLCHHLKGAL